jgi:hypothetical protein
MGFGFEGVEGQAESFHHHDVNNLRRGREMSSACLLPLHRACGDLGGEGGVEPAGAEAERGAVLFRVSA